MASPTSKQIIGEFIQALSAKGKLFLLLVDIVDAITIECSVYTLLLHHTIAHFLEYSPRKYKIKMISSH